MEAVDLTVKLLHVQLHLRDFGCARLVATLRFLHGSRSCAGILPQGPALEPLLDLVSLPPPALHAAKVHEPTLVTEFYYQERISPATAPSYRPVLELVYRPMRLLSSRRRHAAEDL